MQRWYLEPTRRYLWSAAADGERPFPRSAGRLARRECDARFVNDFALGGGAGAYPFAGLQEFGLRVRRERRGRLHDALAGFHPLRGGQLSRRAAVAAGCRRSCTRRGLAAASAPNEQRSAE